MKIFLFSALVLLTLIMACSRKKVALEKEQFIALLIDMHTADGILAAGDYRMNEQKNYAYYNTIFEKHGITKAEFDSCLNFYSAQTVLFSQMYDIIIDSLNARVTDKGRILAELRARDSINLLPPVDTIRFDKKHLVSVLTLDSIIPGLYKFSTTIKFDTADMGKNNRITAYFLSEDKKDTLRVHKVTVLSDTAAHNYTWSQYADSTHTRLVIRMVDSDDTTRLKIRQGKAWNTTLFRPYISEETEENLKKSLKQTDEKTIRETPITPISLRKKRPVRVE